MNNNITQIPIVFLLSVGRSGIYLTKSIFDWHKEVIILPISYKFYFIWDKFQCSNINDKNKIIDIYLNKSKLKRFKDKKFNHPIEQKEYDFSNINWDIFELKFKEYVLNNDLNSRNVHYAIFYAYLYAIGKKIENVKLIIGDGVYRSNIDSILKDFPESRFIHVIRDHRANISSLKVYFLSIYGSLFQRNNGRSLYLHILKDYMIDVMKMLHENQKKLVSDRLKIIKFEDIHNATENTLKDLAKWLNIEFNDSLLSLTLAGKEFFGGSAFSNTKIKGFSSEPVSRWKKHLNPIEIRMIEYVFKYSMDKLNYVRIYKDNLMNNILGFICCFLPWKGEIFYFGHRKKRKNIFIVKYIIKYYFLPLIYIPINIIYFIYTRLYILYLLFTDRLIVK